jgi:hypothetical protein
LFDIVQKVSHTPDVMIEHMEFEAIRFLVRAEVHYEYCKNILIDLQLIVQKRIVISI